MWKSIVVLSVLSCVALAALLRDELQPKPEKFADQEGCFIEELDAVIPIGKSMPSVKECKEYRCEETLVIHAMCSAIGIRPGCTEVVDRSKPFPDCCPKESCPK